MQSIFIVGCGDLGTRVARHYRDHGHAVRALARSFDSDTRLKQHGIEPINGDLDDPDSLSTLPVEGHLLFYFAPPPGRGTRDPRMAALLQALDDRSPQRFLYLSTSGVYGDHQGRVVDEDTVPAPDTDRAQRRLDAEQQLAAWAAVRQVETVVVRVGGIYGPDRLPVARLRAGTPILRADQAPFTNRIHVDDLTLACVAAMERGRSGGIYNLCDDRPGTMTEYFLAVAERLGVPAPPQIDMDTARRELSPAMLSYLNESRRMDNRRMHDELGVVLRYPDLDSGLAGLMPISHPS